MGRRALGTIAVGLVTAAVGFVAGSWWHATVALEPPAGPAVAPITLAPVVPVVPAPASAAPIVPAAPRPEDARCPELTGALATTSRDLSTALANLKEREERRVAREGQPIASHPSEPRFEPEALRTAVSQAFLQEKVPGRVDGLDCTEWPCIIYGRIRGTEDEMEKLEGAKALASYEHDVLTVLLWVVTDEAAHEGPLPILPGRPEQSLYAFAFYPRGLERPMAENVDRRLRTRTADLWNTMSPADETGR